MTMPNESRMDSANGRFYEGYRAPVNWEKWMKTHHVKLKPVENKDISKKTEEE